MTTVPLFVNGEGMSGGKVHYSIEGNPFLGKARTAPRCRFFSVRDEFLALWPVNEDGASIEGELYEVQLAFFDPKCATPPSRPRAVRPGSGRCSSAGWSGLLGGWLPARRVRVRA